LPVEGNPCYPSRIKIHLLFNPPGKENGYLDGAQALRENQCASSLFDSGSVSATISFASRKIQELFLSSFTLEWLSGELLGEGPIKEGVLKWDLRFRFEY
jgi:hypothetical protein